MCIAKRIALILAAFFLITLTGITLFQRSLLYWPDASRGAPTLPGIDVVHIPTRDGETLVAWRHKAEAGQPTFLFFDGNGGEPHIQNGRWRRLIEHGAGFLAVYYRGYAGSSGHPSEAGLHEDARAGYDWLIAQGVMPQEIVLHGFSLGTGIAIKLATERPARALILEAPYSAVVDVVEARLPGFPPFLVWDQFRSRDWIGQVHIPVLFVHGDRDSVIPFTQAKRLYALANQPRQFVTMTGSDHCTLVRDGMYDAIWAFLARYPT